MNGAPSSPASPEPPKLDFDTLQWVYDMLLNEAKSYDDLRNPFTRINSRSALYGAADNILSAIEVTLKSEPNEPKNQL